MMFSKDQIEFMRNHGVKVDFEKTLTDDEYFQIDDVISTLLQTKGFDAEYEPTPIGKMCESILDIMAGM
ncbi:hypothetical protein [Lapidilactobacillus salsurivasis]